MPRKVLIVDDNAVNRFVLKQTLEKDYDVLEAVNGAEALTLILRNYKMLSAILTDIVMPEMDGYELLRSIRANTLLTQIPVIMVTGSEDEQSRVKALMLGANDFILKPFNPEIMLHCVKNNIALRETASILNAIQKDKLTGLYNREAFFERVSATIKDYPSGYFLLSCFDIDSFMLINDQYGAAVGDRILREIGQTVAANMELTGGIGGRISGDNFAVLLPYEKRDFTIFRAAEKLRLLTCENRNIVFSVGRYAITDLSLSASAIYDRAYIAKQSVKGRYDKHIAYFDDAMLEKLVSDQQITAAIDNAVSQRQFEVWFQPQRNHSTGALVGAEALVRWRHPQRGLIPPGEFIPVFEQNGFVYELDKYVWEETCRYLRKWIDAGRHPLPVSVNISRYDVFRADFVDTLTGLLAEYALPASMLRLEITESAFTKSTKMIIQIVEELIGKGFTVEIDDFGSGYSSLNTLKGVPAQVLKLDMRFLDGDDETGRGGNILESIVRMAKWLGMSVIAEGVERIEQADYLASIGCSYIQGYLYARPMPASEYEIYCQNIGKEERLMTMQFAPNLNNNSFWSPESMDTLIFNSYVGAACIFEISRGRIELLRANRKFAQILGGSEMSVEDVLKIDWHTVLDPSVIERGSDCLKESRGGNEEYTGEFLLRDISPAHPRIYLRSTLRVIADTGERMLVYCASENITEQKRLLEREHAAAEQIESMIHDMPGGYAHLRVLPDGSCCHSYFNNTYCTMRGMSREEVTALEGNGVAAAIHPDDLPLLKAALGRPISAGNTFNIRLRLLCGNGVYKWFAVSCRHTLEENGDRALNVYLTDISAEAQVEETQRSLLDNLPCGAGIYELADGQMRLVYQNKSYWELVGLDVESFPDQSPMSAVHNDDIPRIMAELSTAIAQGRDVSCDIRLRHLTRGYRYVHLGGRIVPGAKGVRIYVTFTPIPEDVLEARRQQARLQLLVSDIPGGIAVYEGRPDELDKIRLTYFSDGFCRLFGYTREEYEQLSAVSLLGLVSSTDLSEMRRRIAAFVASRSMMDYTYRARVKGGGMKWINIKATFVETDGETAMVNAVFVDVTEQKNASEELRISEEIYRIAIEQSATIVCRYDVAARRLTTSPKISPIYDIALVEEDVPDSTLRTAKVSPETVDAYMAFYDAIRKGESNGTAMFQRRTQKGWRWIESHFTSIFADSGEPTIAIISFSDVTDALERNVAYQRWQRSIRNHAPETFSLYHCDIGKDQLLGEVEGLLVPAQYTKDVVSFSRAMSMYALHCVRETDRYAFMQLFDRQAMLDGSVGASKSLDYLASLPDRGERWQRLTIEYSDLPSSANTEAYVMIEDVDEAKRAELALLERSETDSLTGLLNRATFRERFDRKIGLNADGKLSALFIIDLDGFKLVNDHFGHSSGDEALIEMSQKLMATFRSDDLICRLGGDEFLIFMSGVPHISAIRERAALLCALLHKSYSLDVQLSASIGVSICPLNGDDFDTLYRKADAALYHVKGFGKDNYALYTDDMDDKPPEIVETPVDTDLTSPYTQAMPKRRMLIVEDNEINREYLVNLFNGEFIVEQATEGTAALVRLRRYGQAISIVLLDLMMPGLDGFDVLRTMRSNVAMQSIPVIVVSGMDERETYLRAIREGASDFITKPVDAEILKLRVASALSKADNEQLRAQNRYLALQNEESRRLAEARKHSEELSDALHAAERADLAKSQFLSSVSHEIRTPLNAVIGYTAIARGEMNDAHSDEERRQASMKVLDCLTKSEIASRQLLTIINDVLDMSAIESGNMKVDRSAFDFRSLISSLTVMFYAQAQEKGVDFEVLFDAPVEEWFVGDQMRINQILTNLLSNAVKFTPEGGYVTLNVTERVVDDAFTDFRFVVTDTGIGMTQEYLERIWTPFEQAEASIARRFGGTGLGLSITKKLVSLMDGEISVSSEPGVGSVFTVDLRLQRMNQMAKPDNYDFSSVNALVVDDDRNTCDYIKLLFDRCGARCSTFTSGEQAVKAFTGAQESGTPYTLCLVDWRMPRMNGYATISGIRRIASKDMPIVVVTAYDFAEVVDSAQKLGINRFVAKPLFQSSLFDLLATVSGNAATRSKRVTVNHDFGGARVLLVEDNNMNMEVARHVLTGAGLTVDVAWNGQEAVDIFVASKPGLYSAILMDVHMPVLDGYKATRMIRSSDRADAATIPIIAMTADVFAEDIAEARNAGMNGHIAKPIDVETLCKTLGEYIKDGTA